MQNPCNARAQRAVTSTEKAHEFNALELERAKGFEPSTPTLARLRAVRPPLP